ncbi:hypothetical protein K2X05_02800 [bacterium]|nr:hypothetical protein [bacterium]
MVFTFISLSLLSPVIITFQNFKHRDDTPLLIDKDDTALNDALITALKKAAEKKRANSKQIALNLETDKKDIKPVKKEEK